MRNISNYQVRSKSILFVILYNIIEHFEGKNKKQLIFSGNSLKNKHQNSYNSGVLQRYALLRARQMVGHYIPRLNCQQLLLNKIITHLIIIKMQKANPLDNPILKQHQAKLQEHPLYAAVNTIEATRLFMERHCFAVWDFFLLIKDLQRKITNTRRFWTPCADVNAARFINEIVIGEETDDSHIDGQYLSHFELYVKAMDEIGANSQPVKDYVNQVAKMTDKEDSYEHIEKRIDAADSPAYVKKFNKNTCQAIFRSTAYTAGQFFFGREDPIPQMFTKIVKTLDDNKVDCPILKWYLNRHIEIDGSSHGPKTSQLIAHLGKNYDPEFKDIIQGAIDAIEHRIWLWDGILEEVNKLGK